ncbi:putative RNA-directed DNA polymerase [Rosa chinensis]|uniref:Putative RNA-directed DNA polymerase n=1 Tax=Rosa chinensis TaxID=74649 RepID=A0A2P6S703_ROSCH|nr:putative RNA-directed DNA polymerase [Rosa chinensis]
MECHICHKKGHIASRCFQNPANTNNGEYGNNNGITPECQICSKRGHTAVNCFYRIDVPADHPAKSIVVCQICGLKGHAALDCHHRSNYSFQGAEPPASLTAMSAHANCNGASSSNSQHSNCGEVWIGDTGATHHMTSDLRNLTIAQPYDSNNSITIGNGQGLSIKHIGAAKLTPGKHTFYLNNVLHVPSLAVNLLSFNKLCRDNQCFITLDETHICVQDKVSKALLYRGKSNGEGLFLFKTPRFKHVQSTTHYGFLGATVKSSLWHHRLGHPADDIASKMLSLSQIQFNKDRSTHMCSHCLSGNMHRLPFQES